MSPLCCTQLRRSCEGDNRHLPVQCHHTVACSWGLVKAIIDIYLFILASQKYTADTLWGWQDIYLSILTLQKYTVEVLGTSRNIHSHVTGSFSCCLIIIWSCFRGWEYGGNSSITMCVCVCAGKTEVSTVQCTRVCNTGDGHFEWCTAPADWDHVPDTDTKRTRWENTATVVGVKPPTE